SDIASLFFGVVVVLDAHPAEERMVVRCHVAGGEDVLDVRSASAVDDDSVLDGDTARLRNADVRLNTETDHGEAAADRAAGLSYSALDTVVALERSYLLVWKEPDSFGSMDLRHS